MAYRQEEAENHWPGFVDALSTIVMVVTFLLIILGVVIFIIAQQIKQAVGTSEQKSTETKQYFAPQTPPIPSEKSIQAEIVKALAATAKAKADEAKANAEQAKSEAVKAKAEASQQASKLEAQKIKTAAQAKLDGKARLKLAQELRQDRKTERTINGQKIISQEVDTDKKITIASEDISQDFKANIVQSANAVLTLIFDEKSVTIDESSATEMDKFLSTKNISKQQGQIEIRSYVNLNQASMGEARRRAFYRAMAARNILLKLAIDPSHISIKVKEVDDQTLNGILKIYLKP